jgi:polar amino acid transport system substrate-binding protein
MRRFSIALALVMTCVLSLLAACGSNSSTGGSSSCKPVADPATLHLIHAGYLTFATDASYPPQEYVDTATQKLTGVDVDLMNEFASRFCLKADVKNAKFDSIITSLTTGSLGSQRYDASLSAFTITDDRKKSVDMIPYFQAGESVLVPKGNPKHITALTDLCGLNVAVENGTVEKDEINGTGDPKNPGLNEPGGACASKHINMLSYDDEDQVVQQLINGRADATYQDSPVTDYYLSLNTGKVDRGPITVAPSPEGIVLRKDNAALEDAFTKALSDMRADNTYKKILDKWGTTADAYPAL